MPRPLLLAGTLRGGGRETPTASRAGHRRTEAPARGHLQRGEWERTPRAHMGPSRVTGGRHTPGLYQCGGGGDPHPAGAAPSRRGLPHPIRTAPAAGGETNPGRHWGGGGTATQSPLSSPPAIASTPPTSVRYRRCPRRSATEPHLRARASSALPTPPRGRLRPGAILCPGK